MVVLYSALGVTFSKNKESQKHLYPMTIMTQLRLVNFLIFVDTNNTDFILRAKNDVPRINSEWMQISIANGIIRIMNQRLDPIASVMHAIEEYSSDLMHLLMRLISCLEFCEFFDRLADISHLSRCLCASVERSAITQCLEKGFFFASSYLEHILYQPMHCHLVCMIQTIQCSPNPQQWLF
jgi:hypothetical protein